MLYIIAVSKDNLLINEVKSISPSFSGRDLDLLSFYFYRTDVDKEHNMQFLKMRFNGLVKRLTNISAGTETLADGPVDIHLIKMLPFIEKLDFSLLYIDKLVPVTDGSISELLQWAFDYLLIIKKSDIKSTEKLKTSYAYKIFHKQK